MGCKGARWFVRLVAGASRLGVGALLNATGRGRGWEGGNRIQLDGQGEGTQQKPYKARGAVKCRDTAAVP